MFPHPRHRESGAHQRERDADQGEDAGYQADYLWQTSLTAMQAFPHRLPFLQFGPPAAAIGAAEAIGVAAAGAAGAAHIAFLAILPALSWQLPLASIE
jgi:hypothetical protein